MVFDNKIVAIKRVRSIGAKPVITQGADGRHYIECDFVGLKEAKDIVEAIMALGVRQFLDGINKDFAVAEKARTTPYVPPPPPINWTCVCGRSNPDYTSYCYSCDKDKPLQPDPQASFDDIPF